MTDFDTLAARVTATSFEICGQAVTYSDGLVTVDTHAVIDKAVEFMGGDTLAGDERYVCRLKVADVGAPERGHTVTDASSQVWVLREQLPGTDRWQTIWSVSAQ
jgi:hypothetical protein